MLVHQRVRIAETLGPIRTSLAPQLWTSVADPAMANRTDPDADTVHGANPQFLVDRIVRVKIYNAARPLATS